jgi:hypothetical protein
MARIRRDTKNAGERARTWGPPAGGLSRGMRQPVEGVRPLSDTLFLAPCLASLSLRLAREREAGVRGSWMLPSANADAPTSTVQCPPSWTRPQGGNADEVDPSRSCDRGVSQVSGSAFLTPLTPLGICTPSEKRPTVWLGEKSDCARYGRREERPEEGREPARGLRRSLLPRYLRPLLACWAKSERLPELEMNGNSTPENAN